MKTKTVRFIGSQFFDLFGVVTLSPGDNEVPLDKFNAARKIKLGDMAEPYMDWAKARGILQFEDDPADAKVPALEIKPHKAHDPDDMSDPRNRPADPQVPELNAEAMTLTPADGGEAMDVVAIGFADPDSPAMADAVATLDAAPAAPAKRGPGRPKKEPKE